MKQFSASRFFINIQCTKEVILAHQNIVLQNIGATLEELNAPIYIGIEKTKTTKQWKHCPSP